MALTPEQKAQLDAIGRAWNAATSQAERDRLHAQANALRDSAGLVAGRDYDATSGAALHSRAYDVAPPTPQLPLQQPIQLPDFSGITNAIAEQQRLFQDQMAKQQQMYDELMRRFQERDARDEAMRQEAERQQRLFDYDRNLLSQSGGWGGRGYGSGLGIGLISGDGFTNPTPPAVKPMTYNTGMTVKPASTPSFSLGSSNMKLFSGDTGKQNAIARQLASSNIFKS